MIVFDAEANGLLHEADTIWCITLYEYERDDYFTFYDGPVVGAYTKDGSIDDALNHIHVNSDQYIAGHHICGYDFPLFKKLRPQVTSSWAPLLTRGKHGAGPRPEDTNVLSQLLYPQQQAHGLDHWGKKFGIEKPKHEDWSCLSEDMLHRNIQDVRINVKLVEHLRQRAKDLQDRNPDIKFALEEAIEMEQIVSQIHAGQEDTGVRLDVIRAVNLMFELDEKAEALRNYIVPRAPKHVVNLYKRKASDVGDHTAPLIEQGHTNYVKTPYKQNGQPTKTMVDYWGSEEAFKAARIGGPFSRIQIEDLNLDSDSQVKEFLLSLGWKPTEWNFSKKTKERTSPKLTEDSYRSLPAGLGQKIAEYNIVTHRRGMILNRKGDEKGALWNMRDDGRVPAEAFTCGTPTFRYRHKGSICNAPRPTSPYGDEIRSMYCVPEGWWMLGMDLKGIEIRKMVHFALPYPGGKEFYEIVMDGDFHANNGKIWDVSRDDSKPGLYGLCYGAQAPKLASILGKPASEGQRLFDAFWNTYPALKHLVDDLERSYKTNRCLQAIDGRRIDVREKRKLLNTLIQANSAIVFKEWMIACNRMIIQNGWTHVVKQIIAYHDELQFEIRTPTKSDAVYISEQFKELALDAGKKYDLRVPIEADAKVGHNWKDCH